MKEVCNLDVIETRKRLYIGVASFLFLISIFMVGIILNINTTQYLVMIAMLCFASSLGFMQAKGKTCVPLALAGFSQSEKQLKKIEDVGMLKLIRNKAVRILLITFLISSFSPLLYSLLRRLIHG